MIEFEKEKNEKYSFINSALKTSKILYERNSSGIQRICCQDN